MSDTVDYYAILGVEPTANGIEIRRAFRARVRNYHPDRNASTHATAITALLNEAWDVLSDPVRRRLYDASREKAEGTRPTPSPFHPPTSQSGKGDSSAEPDQPVEPSRSTTVDWTNRLLGAVLIVIGIGAFLLDSTNQNGWFVIVGWLFVGAGIACWNRTGQRLRTVLLTLLFVAAPIGFLVWWSRRRERGRSGDRFDAEVPPIWTCPRCARRVPRRISDCRCGFTRTNPTMGAG